MKLLFIDLETAPAKAYVWGLFNQNINIGNVVESGYTLSYAAKWADKKKIMFDSVHKTSPKAMFKELHKLLDEADAVCHYNGARFDVPVLNREFLLYGLQPPSPYKQIDLLKTCRRQFRFHSNKLDFVSQELGIGAKTEHKGMQLWRDCMDGDPKAWRVMERYNKQDVKLLEALYYRLLPWIVDHPNMALYNNSLVHQCPKCGSDKLQKRGTDPTKTQIYQRFKCLAPGCGAWSRAKKTLLTKDKSSVILV